MGLMPAFGENLRREREMRGVSLEEISSATKISIRFFQCIENEEFSKLPGGIFSRSFIRSYARYLGLDEERVLAEYQLAAQPKQDVDLHRMMGSRAAPPREWSRASLLALLVAAVMLSGGYFLFRYSRRSAEMPVSQPSQSQGSVAPAQPAPGTSEAAPPALSPVSTSNPPATGEASSAAQTSTSAPEATKTAPQQPPTAAANTAAGAESGLVLQVAASQRAWVAVDADGKTALQRVLSPNEVETLKARNSFDVTTGNAQGIILTLNGETLKPLGRRGEVKSIHLTHDDLKNPAP